MSTGQAGDTREQTGGTALWKPLGRMGTLTDRIADQIEVLIAGDRIGPGERLPSERDLAQMLGVSRPALREAVKRLEAQGRLAVRHGQGVFVVQTVSSGIRSRLSSLGVTLRELFAMREVLDEPAAAWAASAATPTGLSRLAVLLERQEAARAAPVDFDRLSALDAAFHLAIVELAGNRFLLQTVGVLQEMLASSMETTLRIPGRLELSRRDHQDIFDAIAARDPRAARRAAHRHVDDARAAALLRIERDLAALNSSQATDDDR